MNDDRLPTELVDIEQRLSTRRLADTPPALRARVMQSVTQTLANEAKESAAAGQWWSYAASIAATLLIGANLAHVGASVTSFVRPTPPSAAQIVATARTLRQLSPELTPDEATRMSAVLLATADVPCVPDMRIDSQR